MSDLAECKSADCDRVDHACDNTHLSQGFYHKLDSIRADSNTFVKRLKIVSKFLSPVIVYFLIDLVFPDFATSSETNDERAI